MGWKGREIAKKQISEAINKFKSPDLVV